MSKMITIHNPEIEVKHYTLNNHTQVTVTADLAEVLETAGIALGVYHNTYRYNDEREIDIVFDDKNNPVELIVKRYDCGTWHKESTITTDPEKIRAYMFFDSLIDQARKMK